jgi:hypothetical protein
MFTFLNRSSNASMSCLIRGDERDEHSLQMHQRANLHQNELVAETERLNARADYVAGRERREDEREARNRQREKELDLIEEKQKKEKSPLLAKLRRPPTEAEREKRRKEQAAQAQRDEIKAAAHRPGGLRPVIRPPINAGGPSAADPRWRDLPFMAELDAEDFDDLMILVGEEEETDAGPTEEESPDNAEGPMPPAGELPNEQRGD